MADSSLADHEAKAGVLAPEHAVLGAALEKDAAGHLVPLYYGDAAQEPGAFDDGCALADVSSLVGRVVSGSSAAAFVSLAFAGPVPAPGTCGLSLVLRGDGTVASPVLLACLGAQDFAWWAPAETAVQTEEWLQGIAAIQSAQAPVFDDLSFSEANPTMTTLALCGPDAAQVLGDYLAAGVALPPAGAIANLRLDAIDVVMARVRVGDDLWTVVWVPDAQARKVWRSLLSFPQMTPVGSSALWARLTQKAPAVLDLLDDPEKNLTPQQLGLEGLVRPQGGFIGARALEADAS